MSVHARRRLIAGGVLAALIVGVVSAVALTGGGPAPPASGAAKLVPATALAYVHVSTDPHRAGTRSAAALLRRLPGLERAANGLVGTLARTRRGLGVDYRRDIAPWIGKEAALALVDAGNGVASSEIVIGVRDERGARGFLARLGTPTRRERVAGAELDDYAGQAVALVDGYLVTGPDAIVRAAIFLAHGQGPRLADVRDFKQALAGAPADRVLDGYAPAAVNRVLAPAGGPLGLLGALLARPGLKAVGLALTARASAADVWVHETGPGGRGFRPTLDQVVPAGALAFLDVASLDRALPRILAVARKLGVQSLLQQAATALTSAGVDLRSLAPLVRGETAVAVTSAPMLTIVARTADEARARTTLAALQAPLARALSTASTVPTYTQQAVAGVTAYRLRVSPALELDYAVADGKIAVSTGLPGIAAAFGSKAGLAGDPTYHASVTGGSSSTTSILFLDLDQLLRLGAQLGLDQDPRFLAVRSDLRRVHAVGLTASSGETDTTAELSLQIP